MALKKKLQIEGKQYLHADVGVIPMSTQIVTMNAYVKVQSVTCDKAQADAVVQFSEGSINFYKNYAFEYAIDGDNVIKQAYQHLKTLPEFAGAQDC